VIVYPSWWQGFRWDVERLLRDLFMHAENGAAAELSGVKVEPFAPLTEAREAWLAEGNGFLYVHRNGGAINKTRMPWVDEALVTIGAHTKSRDASNELQSYVATVLSEFDEGGLVHRSTEHPSGISTTTMFVPGEVVGPQLTPGLLQDDRLVPTTWSIHADIPRGLPDYREPLGLDH
jgi:hypothetical protein